MGIEKVRKWRSYSCFDSLLLLALTILLLLLQYSQLLISISNPLKENGSVMVISVPAWHFRAQEFWCSPAWQGMVKLSCNWNMTGELLQ